MQIDIPVSWQKVIGEEFDKDYFKQLEEFVDGERRDYTIYPPEDMVFSAFNLTPYNKVNVLLLGQDPYVNKGQAHGLCFSVLPGVA